MSYVQDNLMPNEKVLFTASVHPAVFIQSLFACVIGIIPFYFMIKIGSQHNAFSALLAGFMFLFMVAFFISAVILGLQAVLAIATTEFAVTNRRVIAKTGLVRRHTLEMLLTKIESVAVNQTMLGRIFNIGTVTVTGTGGTKESFRAIGDPFAVRKKISQIIEHSSQENVQLQQQKAISP